MSIQSIQVYRSKVEKIIQHAGTHNESALPAATCVDLPGHLHGGGMLLGRVCRVSVETMKIVGEMAEEQ